MECLGKLSYGISMKAYKVIYTEHTPNQNIIVRIKFKAGRITSISHRVFHGVISSFIKNSRTTFTR